MLFSKELNLLLKARYPIIYISTFEEDRLEYTIRKTIKINSNKAIYTWDFVEGYKTNLNNPRFAAKNPLQALELVEKLTPETPAIFILKEHEQLGSNFYIGSILIILVVIANGVIKNQQKKKTVRSLH